MLYIFGVGLNFFLLLLLLSKKNKSFADKILAGWFFVIGCHLLLYVISFQPITINNIHQIGVSMPFPFLHGPFLYLYTAALTNQLPKRRLSFLFHFLPALLIIVLAMPFFISSAVYKMEVFNNKGKDYILFLNFAKWLMRISGIVYVVWSFILLQKHKKNIGDLFSYEEKINLNWLRYVIYASLAVWIIIIFIHKDSFIFTAVVISVLFLGFFGVRQVGIFGNNVMMPISNTILNENSDVLDAELVENVTGQEEEHIDNITTSEKENLGTVDTEIIKQKYLKSGLSADAAIEIHKNLTLLMEEQKLFTEAELSLPMLAAKLNVHSNYLSQVINEKEGKSFFDYINFLRVEEFKRLVALPESKQFTIMSLAYDCGFNSKSSFNNNFKKVTRQSPSEYITKLT